MHKIFYSVKKLWLSHCKDNMFTYVSGFYIITVLKTKQIIK